HRGCQAENHKILWPTNIPSPTHRTRAKQELPLHSSPAGFPQTELQPARRKATGRSMQLSLPAQVSIIQPMATDTRREAKAEPEGPEGAPERTTSSGIPVAASYGPADVAGVSYEREVGDPGTFPYTRGLYPDMYRKRRWTMRQYAGYASAEESNRRYR